MRGAADQIPAFLRDQKPCWGKCWGREPCYDNNSNDYNAIRRATGGDGGIRTLDRALQPYNGLANRRLQPLGHVSRSSARRDICPTHPPIASARRSSLAACVERLAARGDIDAPARQRFCAPPRQCRRHRGRQVMHTTRQHQPRFVRSRPMIGVEAVCATAPGAVFPHALRFTKPRRAKLRSLAMTKPALRLTQRVGRPMSMKTSAPLRTRNTNRLIRRGRTADDRT